MSRASLCELVGVDVACLIEMTRFSWRHIRYARIAAILVAVSLPAWGRRRVLRTGYCVLQLADDWLDGDRPCEHDPVDVIDDLLREIEHRRFSGRGISKMASSLVADLDALGEQTGEDPVRWLVELLRTLQDDRRRAQRREIWDEPRLRAHHDATFARSLDLLLLATGSTSRARDAQAVVDVISVISVLRDLREDLARGLCNVPREISEGLADPSAPEVVRWVEAEQSRALAGLEGPWQARLDPAGRRAVEPFVRSMQRWLARRQAASRSR